MWHVYAIYNWILLLFVCPFMFVALSLLICVHAHMQECGIYYINMYITGYVCMFRWILSFGGATQSCHFITIYYYIHIYLQIDRKCNRIISLIIIIIPIFIIHRNNWYLRVLYVCVCVYCIRSFAIVLYIPLCHAILTNSMSQWTYFWSFNLKQIFSFLFYR